MKVLRKKQIEEAKLRKEMLTKKFNLNEDAFNIKEFKRIALFDNIIYEVEQENDRLVYHCILTDNHILNLLFVSKYEEDWTVAERPCDDGNYIQAYTIDLQNDFSEIRDIFIDSQNGYLIRTDNSIIIKML